jgi:hypothetical protein
MSRDTFVEQLNRAKELGLDINKLDLDLLERAAYSTKSDFDIYEEGQYFEAVIEDKADVEQFLDDENLFLHFGIPRTGNRDMDLERLSNSLGNTGDFGLKPTIVDPLGLESDPRLKNNK